MPTPAYSARILRSSCQVINVITGQTVLTLTPHLPPIQASVNGEILTLTLKSGRVEIYNVRTRQLARVL